MKKLLLLLAIAALPAMAQEKKKAPAPTPTPAPVAPVERAPGFLERAWKSTQKGASSVWRGTKRVGEKTIGAVSKPFRRGERGEESTEGVEWRQLSMSMVLEPAVVKLPEVRSLRVTVSVINQGRTATQLDFPTTQRIEVLIKQATTGKVLSRFSDDQKVDKEQGFLVVNPGERLEYTATISTREMIPGGSYLVEAYFPAFDQLRTSRRIMPVK